MNEKDQILLKEIEARIAYKEKLLQNAFLEAKFNELESQLKNALAKVQKLQEDPEEGL